MLALFAVLFANLYGRDADDDDVLLWPRRRRGADAVPDHDVRAQLGRRRRRPAGPVPVVVGAAVPLRRRGALRLWQPDRRRRVRRGVRHPPRPDVEGAGSPGGPLGKQGGSLDVRGRADSNAKQIDRTASLGAKAGRSGGDRGFAAADASLHAGILESAGPATNGAAADQRQQQQQRSGIERSTVMAAVVLLRC